MGAGVVRNLDVATSTAIESFSCWLNGALASIAARSASSAAASATASAVFDVTAAACVAALSVIDVTAAVDAVTGEAAWALMQTGAGVDANWCWLELMHTQKQAIKQTIASVLLNAHQCLVQVWGVGLKLSHGSGVWGRSGTGRSAWDGYDNVEALLLADEVIVLSLLLQLTETSLLFMLLLLLL